MTVNNFLSIKRALKIYHPYLCIHNSTRLENRIIQAVNRRNKGEHLKGDKIHVVIDAACLAEALL